MSEANQNITAVPVTANMTNNKNGNPQLNVKYLKLDKETLQAIAQACPEAFEWTNHVLLPQTSQMHAAALGRLTGQEVSEATPSNVMGLSDAGEGTGLGTRVVRLAYREKGEYINKYVNNAYGLRIFDNREDNDSPF